MAKIKKIYKPTQLLEYVQELELSYTASRM